MFPKCDRLTFWKSCVTMLMVGTACHRDIKAQPEPLSDPLPNILLLYADDLGYGDAACYNPSRGLIPTPHIDRLAREGMRWTDAHASSAVCSPSRYTLLTGRYHWRTRLQSGIVRALGKTCDSPSPPHPGQSGQARTIAHSVLGSGTLVGSGPSLKNT